MMRIMLALTGVAMSPSAIAESHINFLECSQERSLYKELEVGQDLKISYIKHEEFMVLKTEKGSGPFVYMGANSEYGHYG